LAVEVVIAPKVIVAEEVSVTSAVKLSAWDAVVAVLVEIFAEKRVLCKKDMLIIVIKKCLKEKEKEKENII